MITLLLTLRLMAPETIAAECPVAWDVERIDSRHGSVWFYSCEATGVTLTIPTTIKRARVKGTTKGQPEASWTR